MLRTILRLTFLASLAALILLIPRAAGATTPVNQAVSNTILAWCQPLVAPYQQALPLTKPKSHAQAVTPPELDPPCKQCGDADTNDTPALDRWIAQAEQPEADALKLMLTIARHSETDRGYIDSFSPAALACWKKVEPEDAKNKADAIMYRLYDKAYTTATTYKKNDKMAWAGVTFLLREERAYSLETTDESHQAEALSMAHEWYQKILDKVDQNVFSGNQYNKCPAFIEITKKIEDISNQVDTSAFTDEIQKMQKFLHFKIKMELTVNGLSDGSHVQNTWKGEGDLALVLDSNKNCFSPQIDGNSMKFTVENWSVTSANGGHVDNIGSNSFDVPIKAVRLSLCADQPRLDVVFGDFPQDKMLAVSGDGHQRQVYGSFFGGFMALTLAGQQALHGASSNGAKDQMQDLKNQMNAHRGDMNWLMGPQGQAVIAKMQSLAAAQTGTTTIGGTGGVPSVAALTADAHADWQNGTPSPVDAKIGFTKPGQSGSLKTELHVTVEQNPQ